MSPIVGINHLFSAYDFPPPQLTITDRVRRNEVSRIVLEKEEEEEEEEEEVKIPRWTIRDNSLNKTIQKIERASNSNGRTDLNRETARSLHCTGTLRLNRYRNRPDHICIRYPSYLDRQTAKLPPPLASVIPRSIRETAVLLTH